MTDDKPHMLWQVAAVAEGLAWLAGTFIGWGLVHYDPLVTFLAIGVSPLIAVFGSLLADPGMGL